MRFYYKIRDLVIEINYEGAFLYDYLSREFSLLACEISSPSIVLNIHIGKRGLPPFKIESGKDIFLDSDERIINQYFKAFLRHFWVTYQLVGVQTVIDLYIPYNEGNLIRRTLTPFFEDVVLCCVSDFFHNSFIIVLQYLMNLRSGALFHCSSFSVEGANGLYVLSGEGQSGKSSLMNTISKIRPIKYCSEDFAFVYTDGELFGYPHLTRVKFKDMKGIDIMLSGKKQSILLRFLDNVNKHVYSTLTKGNNARHYSMQEIFSHIHFTCGGKMTSAYILNRGVKNVYVKELSGKEFCEKQVAIIMNEFNNMVGGFELYNLLYSLHHDSCQEFCINDEIYKTYIHSFKGIKCYEIGLPFMPTVEDAAIELINIIQK